MSSLKQFYQVVLGLSGSISLYHHTSLDPSSIIFVARSTPPSQPSKTGLDVRPSVHTSVRPSTKRFSDLNEIWCVSRGRGVMHDGMPYGLIQGQGQGHVALKVRNSSILKIYLLRHFPWELANDC